MKQCKTCKEFSCGANGSDYVSMKCRSEEGFVHVAADCYSSPNAAELVDKMRDYADTADDNIYGICVNTPNVLLQAADAIEALLTENDILKAEQDATLQESADAVANLWAEINALRDERDAAVADIPRACGYCKWFKQNWFSNGDFNGDCKCPRPCVNVSGVNVQWEWRGIVKEE